MWLLCSGAAVSRLSWEEDLVAPVTASTYCPALFLIAGGRGRPRGTTEVTGGCRGPRVGPALKQLMLTDWSPCMNLLVMEQMTPQLRGLKQH